MLREGKVLAGLMGQFDWISTTINQFPCTVVSRVNAHLRVGAHPPLLMILCFACVYVIHTNGLSAHPHFFVREFQKPMGAYSREYSTTA